MLKHLNTTVYIELLSLSTQFLLIQFSLKAFDPSMILDDHHVEYCTFWHVWYMNSKEILTQTFCFA